MKKICLFLILIAASLLLVGCQKEVVPEVSTSTSPLPLGEVPEEQSAEKASRVTYTIDVTDEGFLPEEITIKVGDTVKWVNARTGSGTLSKASIVGDRTCNRIKSPILKIGEYFEYTFDQAETCRIVEGVTTNQFGMLVVEE